MTDTINGRTLDEIKKALQCRVKGCSEKCDHRCDMCELYVPNYRLEDRYADAHAYIQQLESRLAQVERERDAATKCIENVYCTLDKNFPSPDDAVYCTRLAKISILDYMTGEWRGICPEYTKESSK